jgi:hypothetical protein
MISIAIGESYDAAGYLVFAFADLKSQHECVGRLRAVDFAALDEED